MSTTTVEQLVDRARTWAEAALETDQGPEPSPQWRAWDAAWHAASPADQRSAFIHLVLRGVGR